MAGFPARSASRRRSPFVGRSAELELLRTLVPTAAGEGRRVVLIGGESGSGKSRLVREFAAEAASAGALVLYGACDEVVHTPYGPFVQALDRLTRAIEPDELRAALGAGGGELTRLLPHLAARGPASCRRRSRRIPTPSATGSTRPSPSCSTAVAEARPVLLVIEDGHWADAPTLLLLRHLARPGGDARVLLLATFRDTEADMPETLSETLADLRRSEDVVRLRLGGLSGDEVEEFVRRAAGADSSDGLSDLSRAISDLTEGNAFLVNELWRALIETGAVEVVDGAITLTRPIAELGTPESVREVVSQRLSRLAPETTDLLELAATVGAEFELDIVRRAAGLADAQLLAALDEGVGSGMIEELPSRRLAYRFTHELVRKALYDRLRSARRAELHLRVGEALESAGERSGRVLADLAHHFAAAAPARGDRARSRVQPRRGARCALGTRVRRGGGAVPHGARAPDRARVRAGRGLPRARHCEPPGGQGARRTRRVPLGRGDRARARRAPTCSHEPRSATRRRAGAPGSSTKVRSSSSRRPRTRSATRAPSCASRCSAGSPARSTSGAITIVARRRGRARSQWRGGSAIAPASPPCSCAPTGRAGRARWTRSSRW